MANKIERKQQMKIEKHRITTIRVKGKTNPVFCEHCQQKVRRFQSSKLS